MRRVSSLSRVRRVRCLRSNRCIAALPTWCASAGRQAGVGEPLCHHPTPPRSTELAGAETWRGYGDRTQRRPTCPLAAFSTHHSQRCPFSHRTNDHISSAHSRKAGAGPASIGRTQAACLTSSIFFQRAHHRLETDTQRPRYITYSTAIQRHVRDASPGARLVGLVVIL